MARSMGKPGPSGAGGPVVALTAADLAAMAGVTRWLAPADRDAAAQAAMAAWGLCGVGLRRGDQWTSAMLVTPAPGLPRRHPLSSGGVDDDSAALILAAVSSGTALVAGKRLCVALCRHLHDHVTGIEAQATPLLATATPLAPNRAWLNWLGFRPMRYPLNHYRLDLADTVVWFERLFQGYRRPSMGLTASSVGLTGQAGSAGRVVIDPVAGRARPSGE